MVRNYRMPKLSYGRLVKRKDISNISWEYYSREVGRNKRRSTGTSDTMEAKRIAELWAVDYLNTRNIIHHHGGGITMGKLAMQYLEARKVEGTLSPGTVAIMEIHFFSEGKLLHFFGIDSHPREIRPAGLREYREQALKAGLNPRTINKELSTLSGLLKYAAELEIIDSLPYIKRLPEPREKKGKRVPPYHVARMLAAARSISRSAFLFVVLARFCGLRHSETLSIQWADVDLLTGWIILHRQKNKTDLPAPILQARQYLKAVPEQERTGAVVGSDRHYEQGIAAQSKKKTWAAIVRRARLKQYGYRYHDLRHTFVSTLEDTGLFTDTELMALCRHKTIDANRLYRHVNNKSLQNKLSKL